VAAVWTRRLPNGTQLTGLLIGLGGIVAINLPAVEEAGATLVGAVLVLLATFSYGIAFNLAVPLEERNRALPVIWRAQLAAAVLTAPSGAFGLTQSSFAWSALLAMIVLGALSTGVAFALFTTLVGRVGAARGSVTVYFIPVVAIVLGVVFRGESVAAVAAVGTALILAGAYLTSRRVRTR
ncbi:MAG: DMT family transporter, partial [Nocardioidaceae bacterium]